MIHLIFTGIIPISFVLIFWALLNVSCQVKPTQVSDSHDFGELRELVQGTQSPIVLDNQTLILDARRVFKYDLYHLKGSYSLEATEAALTTLKSLKKREYFLRRLSLMGISPSKKVILLDQGLEGDGEAGQLALSLYSLGIHKLQVAGIHSLPKKLLTQKKSKPLKNESLWRFKFKDHLLFLLNSKKLKSLPEKTKVHFIDVSSAKEYLNEKPFISQARTLNIPWKNFYTQQGRPQISIKKQLLDLKITQKDKIIVTGGKESQAASVCFALLSLGFRDVSYLRYTHSD